MVISQAALVYQELRGKKYGSVKFVMRLKELLTDEKAHQKLLKKAGAIGDQVHQLIEWTLKAHMMMDKIGPPPEIGDEAKWAFGEFMKWKDANNLQPRKIEHFVCCHCHQIAGTVDLLAEVNGKLTACDWKTGKRVYYEALLQNAAYRHCLGTMYADAPLQGLVLRLPKQIGEPGFEAVDAGDERIYFQKFLHAKKVWEDIQDHETNI